MTTVPIDPMYAPVLTTPFESTIAKGLDGCHVTPAVSAALTPSE